MKEKIYAAITAAAILCGSAIAYADTGTVTADKLNVRKAPNGAVLGQLSYGDDVTLVDLSDGWYQIRYDGKTAFVFGNYISITPTEEAQILRAEEEARLAREAAEKAAAERAYVKTGGDIVAYAQTLVGVPYVFGGNDPASGFDCSGFVKYVYQNFGITLPRTSYEQAAVGSPVDPADMQPGDILVFSGYGHVGIYVGNGQYIHAPHTGRTVSVDPLSRDVAEVRRVF